jgi:hypothetical protein
MVMTVALSTEVQVYKKWNVLLVLNTAFMTTISALPQHDKH